MKNIFHLFFLIILIICNVSLSYANEKSLGSVNGENIDKNEFDRLLNAQKLKFEEGFLFNLYIDHKQHPDIEKARKELLIKAKISSFSVTEEELNTEWAKVDHKKITEDNLNVDELKNKLKENLLLEKYFNKEARFKIIDHVIDEILVKQEANQRNISAQEEEIINQLNKIIEKQGGETTFNEFLKQNNATLEDAKNEIKKNIVLELVKKSFENEDGFINYFRNKKINSDIVVFADYLTDKTPLCPKEETVVNNELNEQPKPPIEDTSAVLRTIEYPTVTKSKVEEINNLIGESSLEKENTTLRQSTITETNIIRPVYTPPKEKKDNQFTKLFKFKFKKATKPQLLLPKEEMKVDSAIKLRKEISVEKIIESVETQEKSKDTKENLPPQVNQNTEDQVDGFSSAVSELRRKLEQKLITDNK